MFLRLVGMLCVFVVTEIPPIRGAGGLSAATVERLQSFSCPAEPNRGGAGREELDQKEPGGGVVQICDQGKGALWPPCGLKDHCINNNKINKPKQEREDEHQEEVAVQDSVMSQKTQVLILNTVVMSKILYMVNSHPLITSINIIDRRNSFLALAGICLV